MSNIVPATAGMRVTAAWLNQFVPQPWASVPVATGNGWSNYGGGYAALSCRFINPVTLQVVGRLTVGTVTANTNIGTLPNSTYYPSSNQGDQLQITEGTGVGTVSPIIFYSDGHIQLGPNGITSGATSVLINSIVALDI